MPGKTDLKSRIEHVKQSNRIEDVISRYLRLEKNGKGYKTLCPVHDDTNPSFYVYPDSQSYHCFGCQAHGDVIDFVSIIERVSKTEAVDMIESGQCAVGGGQKKSNDVKPKTLIPGPRSLVPVFKQLIAFYQGNLAKSSEAQEYLKTRGLFDPELVDHFKIGYCSGGARKLLPDDPDLIAGLKASGLLNDRGNETFYTCVTVPVFDVQGVPVGIYGRNIHHKRHLYLKGEHKGILNWQALKVYKEIILAESIIDALSAWRMGVKNVIPLYGTNGLTAAHMALLADHRPEEVILLLDNDDAGRRAIDALAGKLKGRCQGSGVGCQEFRISQAILPDGIKDINDFLTADGSAEAFQSIIDNRQKIAGVRDQVSGVSKDHKPQPSQSGDEITFQKDGASWIVKGIKTVTSASMRVILVVSRSLTPDTRNLDFHSDKVDLYSHRSRKGCARTMETELGIPAPSAEKTLLDILRFIQDMLKARETTDEPDEIVLTQEERAAGIAFLESPDLLDRVTADLDTLGYTGEDRNKRLCYLVATSRRLDSPLSCMIRSQSGAGKSLLMERVAALMPDEDIFLLSRISTQGLYYMPKDALAHKLLIIDERRGSEEADYSIRSLQSRKKLNLAVVMKNPSTGKQQTQFFEIHGPIAYMDSSTEMEANPENENRCFVIYLDESRDQTQAVLKAQQQARTLSGLTATADREAIITRNQNAQRVLRPLKVVIPFADRIQFPLSWLRVRRDHERFLSLIEASAYLHQYQRPVKSSGQCAVGSEQKNQTHYIEATIDDYRIAYDLARDILHSTLSELSKHSRDVLTGIRRHTALKADEQGIHAEKIRFSQRDVRRWTGFPDHVVKRAMKQLYSLEYVNGHPYGQGGRFVYTLPADRDNTTDIEGLTTPDQLLDPAS